MSDDPSPCRRTIVIGALAALSGLLTTACDSRATPQEVHQEDIEESTSADPGFVENRRAESIFVPIKGYRFEEVSPRLQQNLSSRFLRAFERLPPVSIAVKRVVTVGGHPLPVRIVAISYRLPKGVPFAALAAELGREFLGATPRNSSELMRGQGILIEDRAGEHRSESVAFFIGKEIFVYAYAAHSNAPTEDVAKKLLNANS